MISEETKQRIERDAEKTYPVLHLNKNAGPNSRRNQRAYIAGATTYAERVEELERENAALKAEIHKMAETLESLI